MKFMQSGKLIEPKGDNDNGLNLVITHQLHHTIHIDETSVLFHT